MRTNQDIGFLQEIARAAGMDEANRYMRKEGSPSKPWTREAYNVAVKERNRIMDELFPGANI